MSSTAVITHLRAAGTACTVRHKYMQHGKPATATAQDCDALWSVMQLDKEASNAELH